MAMLFVGLVSGLLLLLVYQFFHDFISLNLIDVKRRLPKIAHPAQVKVGMVRFIYFFFGEIVVADIKSCLMCVITVGSGRSRTLWIMLAVAFLIMLALQLR